MGSKVHQMKDPSVEPNDVPDYIPTIDSSWKHNSYLLSLLFYADIQYADMHKPLLLRGCAIESNCVITAVIQSFCIKGVCYYTIFTLVIYSYYMNIYIATILVPTV